MLESLFNKVYQKETPTQMFSCEYCKIFKSIYFAEHLLMAVLTFFHRNKAQYQANVEVNQTFPQKQN